MFLLTISGVARPNFKHLSLGNNQICASKLLSVSLLYVTMEGLIYSNDSVNLGCPLSHVRYW